MFAAADRLNLRCDVVCAAHTMGLCRQEGQRGSVSCERTDSASSSHNTSTGVNFITQPVLRHLKMLKSVWEESHGSPLTDVMPQDSMCPSPANAQRRRDSHHCSWRTHSSSFQHFPPHFVLILGELEGSLLCYHMIISREMWACEPSVRGRETCFIMFMFTQVFVRGTLLL